ncbi:hypothetical protein PG996_004856 [Apiospora saccharicola]|uniref:CCHC-type domain-containing protein n=1 Tax=Apiospora saccharicola TaxID=335842 RepID=A0ABR1VNS7_9PEZI
MSADKNMPDAESSTAKPPPALEGQYASQLNQLVLPNATNLSVAEYNDAPYNPGEHERPGKRQRTDGAQVYHLKTIEHVNPAHSRLDKDQYGNIVITNNKGKRLDNRALTQPRTATTPRRTAATFNHVQGFKTFANDVANTWDPNTKMTVAVMEHNEGDIPAPPNGSALTLPMLPYNDDSAWQNPPEAEKCANCGQFGHRLIDCCVPSGKHGDIFGCPVCNMRQHSFDDCPNQDFLNGTAKFNILCQRRSGKPMIRTNIDVYALAREVHKKEENFFPKTFAFPWTREGAIRILAGGKDRLLNIDYTGDKAQLGHLTDSYATFDTVLATENPPNGSFSYWSQKTKEAKEKAKQNPKVLPDFDKTKFTIRCAPGAGPTDTGS